ncbi:MAG: xanthine dehydrogenase molybdopterin binding subunit, partial [Methylobacteriaceae bacterium]|nr:xanthine dehydrogenase molybdopterin binding subunit [Methylobacteriaceae bacterium]
MGAARPHDSAEKHVTGEARYIDDLPAPEGLLHAYLGLSTEAHARILALDLDAVRSAPGVVAVLTAADIPGENDVSPTAGKHDDPVFATDRVLFHGQPIFTVVAETREAARRACRLASVRYDPLPPAIDIAGARVAGTGFVTEGLTLARGDAAGALASAPRRLDGQLEIGGQDHFYLETHVALAIPGEDGDVLVHSSTQHPSEVQHMVAHVLGLPFHAVTVEVRRMGGGFGGKETQGNLFAAVATLAATKLRRPVKIRPDRDDDMIATGKRHDFAVDYTVGFTPEGRIEALDATFAARCGFSADLSGPVTDRALFHADNAYFYPAVRVTSEPWRTHTVSNTAFRGFGGPQGMVLAERVIEEVAFATGRDPLDIRRLNFYGPGERAVTPYHQTVEDNILPELVGELERRSDYRARRAAIRAFNAASPILKRGLALTPVKFGISFTATQYNQAGALVHVYTDGSVLLNHGGTEMGQGLHVKVAQVVASAFGIDLDAVKITATKTDKVPNTSATAASSGSDLNGMAALDACEQIRRRLVA